MKTIMRPRRSVLFVPAANERALAKAVTLPVDGVILDLEDSVAPESKPAARVRAVATIAAGDFGWRELIVRANGLDTPWGTADLATLARAGADAVLLPKVGSAAAARGAIAVLEAAGAPRALQIWCMIETAAGVMAAAEIARANPRVTCLVVGTEDLGRDLNARPTPDRVPFLASLSLVVLAARAAGIVALDSVHLDLADTAGFVAVCKQGRDMGFDGKTLIHPSQIEPANAAFGPDEAAVAEARCIVAAHASAIAAGSGVAVLDGRLVENLHVATAERTLALATAIAARA
ncbi:MAG: CoA ester lyase [Alphaproteobacteria bacterium]|nr:CoA ester lyase [Alphaproteobacteria bacterium]